MSTLRNMRCIMMFWKSQNNEMDHFWLQALDPGLLLCKIMGGRSYGREPKFECVNINVRAVRRPCVQQMFWVLSCCSCAGSSGGSNMGHKVQLTADAALKKYTSRQTEEDTELVERMLITATCNGNARPFKQLFYFYCPKKICCLTLRRKSQHKARFITR